MDFEGDFDVQWREHSRRRQMESNISAVLSHVPSGGCSLGDTKGPDAELSRKTDRTEEAEQGG